MRETQFFFKMCGFQVPQCGLCSVGAGLVWEKCDKNAHEAVGRALFSGKRTRRPALGAQGRGGLGPEPLKFAFTTRVGVQRVGFRHRVTFRWSRLGSPWCPKRKIKKNWEVAGLVVL